MTAREAAQQLGGAKRVGRGYVARCPAHNDRKPSLSLADGRSGRLIWHCHAGCGQRDVMAALDMRGVDWRATR